jgi:hypothetical protein
MTAFCFEQDDKEPEDSRGAKLGTPRHFVVLQSRKRSIIEFNFGT